MFVALRHKVYGDSARCLADTIGDRVVFVHPIPLYMHLLLYTAGMAVLYCNDLISLEFRVIFVWNTPIRDILYSICFWRDSEMERTVVQMTTTVSVGLSPVYWREAVAVFYCSCEQLLPLCAKTHPHLLYAPAHASAPILCVFSSTY